MLIIASILLVVSIILCTYTGAVHERALAAVPHLRRAVTRIDSTHENWDQIHEMDIPTIDAYCTDLQHLCIVNKVVAVGNVVLMFIVHDGSFNTLHVALAAGGNAAIITGYIDIITWDSAIDNICEEYQ